MVVVATSVHRTGVGASPATSRWISDLQKRPKNERVHAHTERWGSMRNTAVNNAPTKIPRKRGKRIVLSEVRWLPPPIVFKHRTPASDGSVRLSLGKRLGVLRLKAGTLVRRCRKSIDPRAVLATRGPCSDARQNTTKKRAHEHGDDGSPLHSRLREGDRKLTFLLAVSRPVQSMIRAFCA